MNLKLNVIYRLVSTYPIPFQAFVRDPDGYYIEFCNCSHMEEALNPVTFKDQEWSLFKSLFAARVGRLRKSGSVNSKKVHAIMDLSVLLLQMSRTFISNCAFSGKQRAEEEG